MESTTMTGTQKEREEAPLVSMEKSSDRNSVPAFSSTGSALLPRAFAEDDEMSSISSAADFPTVADDDNSEEHEVAEVPPTTSLLADFLLNFGDLVAVDLVPFLQAQDLSKLSEVSVLAESLDWEFVWRSRLDRLKINKRGSIMDIINELPCDPLASLMRRLEVPLEKLTPSQVESISRTVSYPMDAEAEQSITPSTAPGSPWSSQCTSGYSTPSGCATPPVLCVNHEDREEGFPYDAAYPANFSSAFISVDVSGCKPEIYALYVRMKFQPGSTAALNFAVNGADHGYSRAMPADVVSQLADSGKWVDVRVALLDCGGLCKTMEQEARVAVKLRQVCWDLDGEEEDGVSAVTCDFAYCWALQWPSYQFERVAVLDNLPMEISLAADVVDVSERLES